ncbi:MAG TPA: hypothetical protein PLP23_18340, partial [Panacibacter sp.]|nr:hypothetical protein [Panacibacter sp.]
MKTVYAVRKALKVAVVVLFCMLAFNLFSTKVNAQCTTGSLVADITPTTSFQSLSVPTGGPNYWTFSATVGNTYYFSFCTSDGGSASFDSYLTLANNSGTSITTADDICNTDDAIITWVATATATFRIYPTQYITSACGSRSAISTLVYKYVAAPSCSTPVSSAATSIGSTGATANWTGGTNSYIIEYGLTGFTPGTGATAGSGSSTVITSLAGTTSKAITGLTAGSNYQYYVRQVCSGPTYSSNSTVQSFSTLFDPCSSITNIAACGTSTSTTIASGTGAYGSSACGFTTGGKEKIYTFTPATTGVYQIAQTASFAYIDYQYKTASGGCSGTGWTCIKDLTGASTSTTGPTLTAGTQYYIMLDPESTAGGTVTFSIVCPAAPFDPCSSITNIAACGTSTSTTIASGTGAYGSSACGFTTGGKEKIYTFTPATTGVYQIAQTASFAYIDYQYKASSGGCSGTGWTCIQDLTGASTSTTGPTLTAGTQYYIMLDPESSLGGTVTFSIVCPPVVCSATPTPGNATAGTNPICSGSSSLLSLSGASSGAGISYQWQSSLDNVTFTNNSGATSATYSVSPPISAYYRCVLTCSGTGTSANSGSVLVTVNNPVYATYNGSLFTEGFESWVSSCSISDVPTTSWKNTPVTGDASWRRDDQGVSSAAWASSSGAYSPLFSVGAHSARFHSYDAASATTGKLDLYINMSAATGSTELKFDYVNTSGSDVLKVYQSTNGGSNFTQIGSSLTTSATFTTKTFTITSTSATTVIRFEATSDFGTTDIGIDNLKLGVPCTVTASVNPSSATICAGQSVTLNENGGTATSWSWTGGGTTQSISVSPSVTTTYTVTATGTPGCTATASATITVNAIPAGVTAAASATSICEGNSVNLTSSATPYSVTALSQNFNGGFGTWTTVNSSTGGTPSLAAWTARADGYNYDNGTDLFIFHSNDNSQFVLTNSDAQGSGGITNTELKSPAFSTVGYTTLNLSLYHYFEALTGDLAKVEVSTNGTTWTTVKTYSTNQGLENSFVNDNINLDTYVGNAILYVRFKYTASYGYLWAIDNVTISGLSSAFTYAWTSTPSGFTSTQQNPTGVAPIVNTTYQVTVSNASNCSAQASTSQVTVNPSSTEEETASNCDSYTWSVNGQTYTTSGDKTAVIGCVTHILHLTITPSSTEEETASNCDSYTWSVNG